MPAALPRTIAIIGARAGSKGLPGKNLLPIGGKPLLVHTIEHAKVSGVCDVVLVSTEDERVARIARDAGAEVPFLRPRELAEDSVPAEPMLQHALVTYEQLRGITFDIVVYLQTTDLFRTPDMIRECVHRLAAHPELDTVFSGYKTHKNYWHRTPEGFQRLAPALATYTSRQSRKAYLYREDTGVACATRASLIRAGQRVGSRVDIVETNDFRTSIDIHTPLDFWLAEQLLRYPEAPAAPLLSGNGAGGTDLKEGWLGDDVKTWSQSIRNGYARAFILFALHETGVFEVLRRSGPKTVKELAAECGLNAYLLDGVLHFLAFADRVLQKEGDRFALTDRGKWLFTDPVLAMSFGAVGAYACLLYELVPALREETRYGVGFVRRGDWLARGSYYTGKSNYPWVVSELTTRGVRTFADLGCGSGETLIAFCRLDPALRGIGIDISEEALEEARRRVAEAGLTDRIRLVKGDFTRPETFASEVKEVGAFNGIMSFHEFLRDGEEPVVQLFAGLKRQFPGRYIFVGEFNRLSDEEVKALPFPDRIHPLFYQYIIHPLTWQGLPTTKARWLSMFERAGLELELVKDDFPFRLVEYILRT